MNRQLEQNVLDAIYGKSYDTRWHSVVSDTDFETFQIPKSINQSELSNVGSYHVKVVAPF